MTEKKDRLLMSVAEVAEELGYCLQHTYKLIEQGVIPSIKADGGRKARVRVPRKALLEYIDAHTRKSNLDLSESASNALNRG